jgi:hypothetical protein
MPAAIAVATACSVDPSITISRQAVASAWRLVGSRPTRLGQKASFVEARSDS